MNCPSRFRVGQRCEWHLRPLAADIALEADLLETGDEQVAAAVIPAVVLPKRVEADPRCHVASRSESAEAGCVGVVRHAQRRNRDRAARSRALDEIGSHTTTVAQKAVNLTPQEAQYRAREL